MNHSLYFHIPFCAHRCAYCDFNTYAGQEKYISDYVDALCKEINFTGRNSLEKISLRTIFFGGGTPSLLLPAHFAAIFKEITDHFELMDGTEITMEANPGTISLEKLRQYRALGINRISLGVQSANGEELRMLERAHNYFDVIEGVTSARKAGFDNLNLDLIYGLPEQTLQTWQLTVKRILNLRPEHISAYALTLEHGTPFGKWSARGLLPNPDPDRAADMYDWASDVFESEGYFQYEISNWARENHQCQHNLQYWRSLPYLGLGAGAHGYTYGYRYSNVLRIKTYIERWMDYRDTSDEQYISDPSTQPSETKIVFPLTTATVNSHRQTIKDDMSEFMITGLRLTHEGVTLETFYQRFGVKLMDIYGNDIAELMGLGLLEKIHKTSEGLISSEVLRLTHHGRLLGNQVFLRFV